ncbi:MAG: sugar phosphate isomerase/epimerase [Planctomycetota bacterium]|nr:sugar phosphate isomerase/epimerase [Planctomycetota bacterium]
MQTHDDSQPIPETMLATTRMAERIPRRDLLSVAAGAVVLATVMNSTMESQGSSLYPKTTGVSKLKYCLNTSTIHGEVIPILDQVSIAQKAGYDSIEIWLRDVDKYTSAGGTLKDLRKRISDAGLTLESAIAFAPWILTDLDAHKKALEQAKKEMEIVVALGGKRIAAPPAGAVEGDLLNLDVAGQRYRALLELGRSVGCLPMLEVWGFSKNLSKLSEVLHVAAAAQHPDACVLPDVYHLYKGGSNFNDLGLLAGTKIPVFHMNDYPDMVRDKISDADRVYPGDGIAPIGEILKTVIASGFNGVLSLELFNREYWKLDPLENATVGLKKMKSVVPTGN